MELSLGNASSRLQFTTPLNLQCKDKLKPKQKDRAENWEHWETRGFHHWDAAACRLGISLPPHRAMKQ